MLKVEKVIMRSDVYRVYYIFTFFPIGSFVENGYFAYRCLLKKIYRFITLLSYSWQFYFKIILRCVIIDVYNLNRANKFDKYCTQTKYREYTIFIIPKKRTNPLFIQTKKFNPLA